MKTIELSTASQPLSAYAEELTGETVILTLNGKAIAAVVSLKEGDRESLSLSMNPEFAEIIEKAREEFKVGKKLSLEEMKREVLP
ncbi:hypothetical protein BCD67_12860 [Oscillatoriales cyanobacterium USR001]|nr:hypothetical protein BCD67_12860 [Oscillatoriales cyanobacterium USR001]